MTRPLSRLALGAAALALAVSAAACGSSAAADKKASPAPTPSTAPSPAQSSSAAGGTVSGKTAKNDKFVWTASKVDYAATVPDDDNKTKKPSEDGKRFCLITTTVKNVSSADQDIAALDFEIVDGTGDENTAVGLLTGDPGFPFATQTQLPTGTEKTVQMVFEVPNTVKATDLVVGGDFTKPGTGFKIALG